jgi:hypothetical protein
MPGALDIGIAQAVLLNIAWGIAACYQPIFWINRSEIYISQYVFRRP